MRYFLFAVLFACIIAIVSSNVIMNHQFPLVQAQDEDPIVMVRKVVQGSIPDSNWEYVWYWSGISGGFTIDKAGGVTSIFNSGGLPITISEKMKSGYTVSIVYGSMSGTVTATNGPIIDSVVTIPLREDGVFTYYADFYNSYTPQEASRYTEPRYVGGEMTTVNKLGVLAPYLGLVVFLETLAVVMTKRKDKTTAS